MKKLFQAYKSRFHPHTLEFVCPLYELIRTRRNIWNDLPKFKVHQFGSSVNGLGFKGCDLDVCLQTNFEEESFYTEYNVLRLLGHLDARFPILTKIIRYWGKYGDFVEELLREFFFHYLTYDFSRIMQPSLSSSIPVADFVPDKDSKDKFEEDEISKSGYLGRGKTD
ncbi:hypothetical protein HNY73_018904 [Argiope bruennichi]|uniref:Poly(A) RNA polymerase mitochondrial-like central palm domain-containing protein n=1 Tax=Argiope bruennichi TaxID=94029 RepID=A0A8T0EFJ9_ARGBR|nr:hypothetical protein HNY73_018904 [Argiope bruennichi]